MLSEEATPVTSREAVAVESNCTDAALVQLLDANTAAHTRWRKLWLFAKYALLRRANPLEQHVLSLEPNDCAFVAKYAQVTTVRTPFLSVPHVVLHTLHLPHPLVNFAKENPLLPAVEAEVDELPVMVFVHGLGGQMSQFAPLMGLLSQCLEIMALDLPGFGDSRMAVDSHHHLSGLSSESRESIAKSVRAMAWSDFTSRNIAKIVVLFIEQMVPPHKKVILVGHSMGTHLCIKAAALLPKHKVEGLVLLSPPRLHDDVETPPAGIVGLMRFFTYFPFLFNLFRVWDRLGGLNSHSVLRQVTLNSNIYIKLRQFRWNMDSLTPVLLRYVNGFEKATHSELISAVSRFNDVSSDKRTYAKTFVACGVEDKMTPVGAIHEIHKLLTDYFHREVSQVMEVKNAGHSLLLAKPEFISGIILNHFELHLPERLHISPAWVLKLKADISGDKWGLKNERKWLQIQGISHNITNGLQVAPLLGMKTLREGDATHSPKVVEDIFYGSGHSPVQGKLVAIVDISADIPPYSPKSFEKIQYYKCATVSKVVPDKTAIRRFLQLIDDILSSTTEPQPLVAVHCHYGFNRTGFLICCYLVERLGWSVNAAVEGFRAAKLPGIKHPHFLDALYVRYER